jgi:hypothetical protein
VIVSDRSVDTDRVRQWPWTTDDLIRWIVFSLIGVAGVVVAWVLVSGRGSFNAQVGLIGWGIGGVIFACIGNAMLILRGRRAIGDRAERIFARQQEQWPLTPALAPEIRRVSSASEGAELVVAGDGLNYFHRLGCEMAQGRAWLPADRTSQLEAGRRPCPACQP